MKFLLFLSVVAVVFCSLKAEEETKKAVETEDATSDILKALGTEAETSSKVRAKKASDCVQFVDKDGKTVFKCAEGSQPTGGSIVSQQQLQQMQMQFGVGDPQSVMVSIPQPGQNLGYANFDSFVGAPQGRGAYGSSPPSYAAPAPAPSYGSASSSSSYGSAPSYAAPAPSYSAPAPPSYPGPAKTYSYPAHFAPQSCGTNLLFSCQPSVAPVPCQGPPAPPPKYSPSYGSSDSYSAPAPSYKAASGFI